MALGCSAVFSPVKSASDTVPSTPAQSFTVKLWVVSYLNSKMVWENGGKTSFLL